MCPSVPHCHCETHIFLFSFWFRESSLFRKVRKDNSRKLPVQILGILAEGWLLNLFKRYSSQLQNLKASVTLESAWEEPRKWSILQPTLTAHTRDLSTAAQQVCRWATYVRNIWQDTGTPQKRKCLESTVICTHLTAQSNWDLHCHHHHSFCKSYEKIITSLGKHPLFHPA